MRKIERPTRRRFLRSLGCLGAIALLLPAAHGQEDEGPPLPKKPGVKIVFLPPPIEGKLSLGIYDKAGKLVRTLQREATEKDFVIGLNGLILQWDGKTDAGQVAPAGKYSARGFSMGNIEVEGVAFHCNEWMDEEEPLRIKEVVSILGVPGGELLVHALGADGKSLDVRCNGLGVVSRASAQDSALLETLAPDPSIPQTASPALPKDAPLSLTPSVPPDFEKLPGVENVQAACAGREGAVWLIDKTAAGTEVKEYSRTHELLRRLAIAAEEPEPWQIAASTESETIFLLERGPKIQRLRGLALDSTAAPAADPASQPAAPASNWKTFLSKSIVASDSLAAAAGHLEREKPFVPEEKIRVRLLPNPLFKDAIQDVDVRIATDAKGSFFATADGLPLRRITATSRLKWSAMGREGGKVITIFQGDGTVVEEFKARRLANMMAFDAGTYEWAPGK